MKKTIRELEIEYGIFLRVEHDPEEEMEPADFNKFARSDSNGIGVNYEDRVLFLKNNGYEVTRENLMDSSLSSRPSIEE
jgi:hypothetical protein